MTLCFSAMVHQASLAVLHGSTTSPTANLSVSGLAFKPVFDSTCSSFLRAALGLAMYRYRTEDHAIGVLSPMANSLYKQSLQSAISVGFQT
jgi:hypothetical protein